MGRTTSDASDPLLEAAGKRVGGWPMLGRMLCSFFDPKALGGAALMLGVTAFGMFLLYEYGDTDAPNPCEGVTDATLTLLGKARDLTVAAGGVIRANLTSTDTLLCIAGKVWDGAVDLAVGGECVSPTVTVFSNPSSVTDSAKISGALQNTFVDADSTFKTATSCYLYVAGHVTDAFLDVVFGRSNDFNVTLS